MSITAKELAKRLSLSEAAVSMALNNKPGVSTHTRKRVISAAKEYDYDFTKINNTSNSTKCYGTIVFILYRKHGAIVSDTPFFSQLSEGISHACEDAGYYMNIQYLYDYSDIEARLKDFSDSGCKGIIFLGTEMHNSDLSLFKKVKIPMVLLDCYFADYSSNYVLINNQQGSYIATDFLIKRHQTQPGYLQSSYSIQNFIERADGFYKAIRINGMSTSRSIVHKLTPSVEGAYCDMLSILQNGDILAKCYFADNDLIAAGAIKAIKEFGYSIPNDISIIGFDDIPLCTCIEPTLTTIEVPKRCMGELAAKRLFEVIASPKSLPIKIEVETKLIVRDSV